MKVRIELHKNAAGKFDGMRSQCAYCPWALVINDVLREPYSSIVIDRAAAAGESLDFLTRARVRADVGTIAHRSREAVDLLLNVHGAGSFAEANPMQRVWRDLETCSRHAVVNPEISTELYGRALLGVEEQITALI